MRSVAEQIDLDQMSLARPDFPLFRAVLIVALSPGVLLDRLTTSMVAISRSWPLHRPRISRIGFDVIVMDDLLDGDQNGLAGFELGFDLGLGDRDSAVSDPGSAVSRRSRMTLTSGSTYRCDTSSQTRWPD